MPSLAVGYIWHAGVHAAEVAQGLERIGFEIVAQVIWDKGLFAMGRSWYHWSHEPCWVVRKKGAKVRFLGTRDQATIWHAPSPKMIMAGSNEPRLDHPTQKPLVLFETPIRNHLKPGEALYEPFSGSGTALIAAERTGTRSTSRLLSAVGNGSAGRSRSGSMARRAPPAKPASGATVARVRRSRSKAATDATRALRAHVDALIAKVARQAAERNDSTRWALRYLEASRPTSVIAPAPSSAADKAKLASQEADQMVGVLRAVLEGLNLSDADYTRGIDLAIKELRAAAGQGWEPL